ncbi:Protein MucA [Pseudomonas coronafaciens pv. coronafaciens]|uniref:LexA family protein n=1 Tax=Pseudomonas coronafaciens TaxID=53409 RepID=UPI000F00F597|nr:S24 family peptidase [Pseudomonas coronafaciens]RMS11895.1 Protein MucA [Pseudomonas coronafaciens pv. coronafaciens]
MLEVLGPVNVGPNPVRKPVTGRVSCGFPSPALEYSEPPLSIDELVSLREPSRWLLRADGDSLKNIGIYDGDVLVVDKAMEPLNGDIVVVVIGSDFCCKEFRERLGQSPLLVAHNPLNADVEVGDWEEIDLWGIVLYNLHRVSR